MALGVFVNIVGITSFESYKAKGYFCALGGDDDNHWNLR